MGILKIGVIGTGRIAERFIPESEKVSGVHAVGVYNPNGESAERFADRWGMDCCKSLE